jgi:hypothetical protein
MHSKLWPFPLELPMLSDNDAPIAIFTLVPNFADTEFFKPIQKTMRCTLEKLGLPKKFTIAYAGAIGRVNAVNEILILAEVWQRREILTFNL